MLQIFNGMLDLLFDSFGGPNLFVWVINGSINRIFCKILLFGPEFEFCNILQILQNSGIFGPINDILVI